MTCLVVFMHITGQRLWGLGFYKFVTVAYNTKHHNEHTISEQFLSVQVFRFKDPFYNTVDMFRELNLDHTACIVWFSCVFHKHKLKNNNTFVGRHNMYYKWKKLRFKIVLLSILASLLWRGECRRCWRKLNLCKEVPCAHNVKISA